MPLRNPRQSVGASEDLKKRHECFFSKGADGSCPFEPASAVKMHGCRRQKAEANDLNQKDFNGSRLEGA